MTGRIPFLVLGAGPAGTRAAETLRRRAPEARVVVVAEDAHPFYNRILLSKQFLASDAVRPEEVVLTPAEAYAARGIELRLGARVVRLDPAERKVELATGEILGYERALVATGSRAARLPAPGADLAGVHTLRTLDDAVRLRAAARAASRAIVVGGGLIGVEVAAALAGRAIATRLLAREPWLFGHVAPEPVGRALERALARGGVEVRLAETVVAIEEDAEGLAVRTAAGRVHAAPLVVAGVGVRYATEFLAGTGLLAPDGGVIVDAWLETAAEGLWAAGDVAAFDDPVLGARRHVEHWLHAQHQGRHAARAMTGEAEPYRRVSTYDTSLFGVAVAVAGAPELARAWTFEGDVEGGEGTAVGGAGGRTVAAIGIGGAAKPAALAERVEYAAAPARE